MSLGMTASTTVVLLRRLLSSSRGPKHVFPSFVGANHTLTLSNGQKRIQIHMRHPDRSKLLSGFWEHKLLSPSLSALGMHDRRSLRTGADQSSNGSSNGEERPPRRMADSYCEVRLPFRSEPKLLEDYASINGGIRVGKLLEDLDVLAASIAYLHCDDLDLTIVTAAVDRIDLLLPIDSLISDVRLRGSITYVGRSSLEATISVETDGPKGGAPWQLAALAKFILVARSPNGDHPVEVNRLLLETEREREIYARGAERHAYRLKRSERSLFRQPPAADEVKLVHELCMNTGTLATLDSADAFEAKAVPMETATAGALRICHPQERNIHNFIFGGYLCREAFELAFAAATVFMSGRRPNVRSVDDIAFVHPVPIGSIVDFQAQIVHSRIHAGSLFVCVSVQADVVQPSTASRLTTNTFHFIFTHRLEDFGSQPVPMVEPRTYVEAMRFLEGKRRVDFDLDTAVRSEEASPAHFDPGLDAKK